MKIEYNDFEDALQYLGAKSFSSGCIITNDKSFYKVHIPTLRSRDFVKRYLQFKIKKQESIRCV